MESEGGMDRNSRVVSVWIAEKRYAVIVVEDWTRGI